MGRLVREYACNNASAMRDFFSIEITYDNRAVVCVNRSSRTWSVSNIGRWFSYNTTSGLDTGTVSSNNFTLKALNGWVCYNPFRALPQVPTLLFPPDHSGDIAISPTFQWTRATGALQYQVQIDRSIAFSNPLERYVSEISLAGPDLSGATTYYWRARAQNARGVGEWSRISSFTTRNR